jgi:hypothetical protein
MQSLRGQDPIGGAMQVGAGYRASEVSSARWCGRQWYAACVQPALTAASSDPSLRRGWRSGRRCGGLKLYKARHLVEMTVARPPDLLERCFGPLGNAETVHSDKHSWASDP